MVFSGCDHNVSYTRTHKIPNLTGSVGSCKGTNLHFYVMAITYISTQLVNFLGNCKIEIENEIEKRVECY